MYGGAYGQGRGGGGGHMRGNPVIPERQYTPKKKKSKDKNKDKNKDKEKQPIIAVQQVQLLPKTMPKRM